ncbi:hypothetical protein AHAS_Ahas13G0313100 [Arachis hypogaea]
MAPEVDSLIALKNLILHAIGQQHTKRAKKIRYQLRNDKDIRLFRAWHNRFTNVHLLKLFVFLVDLGRQGSSADTVVDVRL